jgi:hypothetical protein
MIISKTGTLKTLRILGILCAIAMGFMTLVGTSEDDATDALGVDDSVEAKADLELEEVTVAKPSASLGILAEIKECNTISVKEALDAVKDDIENYDKLDINSVDLRYVSADYTATWSPAGVTTLACSLTIDGEGTEYDTEIFATAFLDGTGTASGTIDDTALTTEQLDVLQHYLDNRSETFDYCVVCDETDITSYSVTYEVDIGVTVKGDVDVL